MINPEDIKAGLVLGHADAALLRDVIKRAEAAETKLAELEKQEPAGKFAFEPLAERYHHIKHGEAQHMEPKLPLVKLFTRPAPAINLEELVPSKLEEKEGDYQSLRDEKRGYNACIDKIMRNIEEQSK